MDYTEDTCKELDDWLSNIDEQFFEEHLDKKESELLELVYESSYSYLMSKTQSGRTYLVECKKALIAEFLRGGGFVGRRKDRIEKEKLSRRNLKSAIHFRRLKIAAIVIPVIDLGLTAYKGKGIFKFIIEFFECFTGLYI